MYELAVVQHFAERGIRQGILQGRMLSVLDLISERFNPNNTEILRPTLESIEDADLLRQILVKAGEAETFSEFQQALNALSS
jgi:hypothetical protein